MNCKYHSGYQKYPLYEKESEDRGRIRELLYTGFSVRILLAEERCNVAGEYFERGFHV